MTAYVRTSSSCAFNAKTIDKPFCDQADLRIPLGLMRKLAIHLQLPHLPFVAFSNFAPRLARLA